MFKSAPDRHTRLECHETLIRPRDFVRGGILCVVGFVPASRRKSSRDASLAWHHDCAGSCPASVTWVTDYENLSSTTSWAEAGRRP